MQTQDRHWLYQQIVERTNDAIVVSDREGIIRLWNEGAEAILGYTAREAIGQSLDLIVPERQRERHWEGYGRVMATGTTKYGRELLSVPTIHKSGSRLSIEFSLTLLKDEKGKLIGAAAIMRDVTERWQQERALKERLSTLEAREEETTAD